MRNLIVTLWIAAALIAAPSTSQWSLWNSAITLHKLGYDLEFQTGNPFTGSRVAQWFCLWACVPYMDAPVDLANWPQGRFKRLGVARVQLPGQPEGCANAGPESIQVDGSVQFRCLDGRRFIPAVGDVQKYVNSLDELKAGRVTR